MNSTKLHKNRMGKKSTWLYMTMLAGIIITMMISIPSCEVFDPEEDIPSYIEINTINLTVNPVTEGTASNKITDAWVYCDGELIGVFELPCKFPVLQSGYHNIIVKAGIKINGISGSRGYYPFYMPFEQRVELLPGQVVTLTPTVSYYPDKVQYKEGFEDGGISLQAFGDSDTTILKTSTPGNVFEGSFSGIMTVNAVTDYYLIATNSAYDMPKTGTPVFLEMNYKTSAPLTVGLIAVTYGDNLKKEIMTLNANDSWNKIYINLTGVTSSNQSASNFKIYFEVYRDTAVTEAVVLLDNLKLLYNE